MPVVHFGEYIMELEKNMKLVILIASVGWATRCPRGSMLC